MYRTGSWTDLHGKSEPSVDLLGELKSRQLLAFESLSYVFERKSTALVIFDHDQLADGNINEEILHRRSEIAVEKSFNLRDSANFNALQLASSIQERGNVFATYQNMGFFIYLTYLASRNPVAHPDNHGQKLSVLGAMRFADFQVTYGDKNAPSNEELRQRLQNAIVMLGIPNAYKLASDWYLESDFDDMKGIRNYGYAKEGCIGVFAKLGEILCLGHNDPVVQLQRALDFALGCRDDLFGKSDDELYTHAEMMLSDEALREEQVIEGSHKRLEEIKFIARQKYAELNNYAAKLPPKTLMPDNAIDGIAALVPNQILKFILDENITINYTYDSNIDRVFHVNGNVPGMPQDNKTISDMKLSRALSETRIDYVMISAGMPRLFSDPPFTTEQKNIRMASSTCHEMFHQIYFDLNENKDSKSRELIAKMHKAVNDLGRRVARGDYNHLDLSYDPVSLVGTSSETVTLKEVLNINSPYYSGYNKEGSPPSKKEEEVLAHLFELTCVEMKDNSLFKRNSQILEMQGLSKNFQDVLQFAQNRKVNAQFPLR